MNPSVFVLNFNHLIDLANVGVCLAIMMYCKYKYEIEDSSFIILVIHFFIIFLTNYVLFPPEYLADQMKYFGNAYDYRNHPASMPNPIELKNDFISTIAGARVSFASWMFSVFPLPFINSVYSTSMVNFLMYFFLYVFLVQKNLLKGPIEYFYLFYPNLVLYSSTGSRDIFIFVFMMLFLYFYLVERKIIVAIVLAVPLAILKYQNAAIIIITVVIHMFINYKRIKKIYLFFGIALLITGFFLLQKSLTLENINRLRLVIYLENSFDLSGFYTIRSWGDLALFSITSAFGFLMEPYLWSVGNGLQLFQAIENIIIAFVMVKIIVRYKKSAAYFGQSFVTIFFLFGVLLYSMAITNSGTAARYRFPFIAAFCVFYMFFGHSSDIADQELATIS